MKDHYFTVQELRKNRYRIADPLGVHMDLIIGKEKALLFDTGYGIGDLKKTVREITDLPLYVLASHGHVDHACGNREFDEEGVGIHPADMVVCEKNSIPSVRNFIVEYASHFPDPVTGDQSNLLPEGFDSERYCNSGTGRLIPVQEGMEYDLGDTVISVIEVPGHTRGSIGLLDSQERLFYAGDSVGRGTWLFMQESTTLPEYADTIRKIQTLDFDDLVFAHMPGTTPKSALEDYLDIALTADYSKGYPYENPLAYGKDLRICCREGYKPGDDEKPGFAAVVLAAEQYVY